MKPASHALITPFSIKHFLIQGLVGCLIGTWTGFLNLILLTIVFPHSFEERRFYEVALTGLCGIIAGAIQGGFLRRATRPALLWLILSGTGWFIVGFVASQVAISWSTGKVILYGGLYGGLAALPQWLLLQRSLSFAAFWLALSASTWSILLTIIYWQSDLFHQIPRWIINYVLR